MPSLILVQLIGLFALIVLANSFPLWIATGPDWRDRPSTPRLIVEFPLANINLAALALTYALVKTRRWRADWRAFQNASSELLERFATDEALNDPCGTLDRIPEEPPNIYLEVPPQPLVRWDRKQPGTEWLDRDNAEYLLVACAFRLLADLGLRGAYVGCSYHDTDRLGAVFDSTPVRALKTRRRGGLPVYTFRVDGERTHLVATFVVQRNGNIFTLAWHAVALRSTPLESVLQVGSWSVFSFVGIGAASLLMPCLGAVLLPLSLMYLFVSYPPGRGWTSLWAKATRDRLHSEAGTAGESWGERLEREAFLQNMATVFDKLRNIKITPR